MLKLVSHRVSDDYRFTTIFLRIYGAGQSITCFASCHCISLEQALIGQCCIRAFDLDYQAVSVGVEHCLGEASHSQSLNHSDLQRIGIGFSLPEVLDFKVALEAHIPPLW